MQSKTMDENTENLAEWMANLPETLKQIPIINLAIPGSIL